MKYFDSIATRFMIAFQEPVNTSSAFIMGVYTFLWGLYLANPFWSVFDQAPLYWVLASIAPEWVWGSIAIVCGIFIVLGILRHSYRSLTNGAFVGFLHWTIISTAYFWSDWQNTGGLTALTIAIYSAFIWLNLKVNKDFFISKGKIRVPVD